MPPTFFVYLAWLVFAFSAPFLALWAAWHAVRPATRRYGLRMLAAGLLGSATVLLGCALLLHADSGAWFAGDASIWLFWPAGGFTVLAAPVGVFGRPNGSRAGAA